MYWPKLSESCPLMVWEVHNTCITWKGFDWFNKRFKHPCNIKSPRRLKLKVTVVLSWLRHISFVSGEYCRLNLFCRNQFTLFRVPAHVERFRWKIWRLPGLKSYLQLRKILGNCFLMSCHLILLKFMRKSDEIGQRNMKHIETARKKTPSSLDLCATV